MQCLDNLSLLESKSVSVKMSESSSPNHSQQVFSDELESKHVDSSTKILESSKCEASTSLENASNLPSTSQAPHCSKELGNHNNKADTTLASGDNNKECAQATSSSSKVTRVYKKCASNGSLAVYVGTRTLTVTESHLEPLKGVLVFDQASIFQTISENAKIWGQINLTFRYGREDEEVLGLRFCNEAILALKQLWPPLKDDGEESEYDEDDELTPLQSVLLDRVNSSTSSEAIKSLPFTLCAGPVGMGAFPPPPSVLLSPAKPYRGSPIGTIYDLRIYASERPEERPPRRNLIRLALRAVQIPSIPSPLDALGCIEGRPMFLSRGKIRFQCELNTSAVHYGEPLEVKILVQNNSRSSIRKIVISLIQQVDVCMFTSGKFKNIVGSMEDPVVLVPGATCQKSYILTPMRGPARQWLALEEAFGREPVLAPSTASIDTHPTETSGSKHSDLLHSSKGSSSSSGAQRNVFAIIVSYYVKAKLVLGGLSLCQNVKVPFILLPPQNSDDTDPYPSVPVASQETDDQGQSSDRVPTEKI